VYQVRFGGLASSGGSVHVTAYGPPSSHCKVGSWYPDGDDLLVNVRCFNAAGAPVDAQYTAMFQAPIAGDGPLGYVWANDPAAATYTPAGTSQFNSTGPSNAIDRLGAGFYEVTFPGLADTGGTVMVTAYGTTSHRCNLAGWSPSGADQSVFVSCFDSAGAASDTRFVATFVHDNGLTPAADRWAYVWANEPASGSYTPDAAYQLSSLPGSASIVRSGVGVYAVTLPGHAGPDGTHVQVSSYGTIGRHCNVSSWGSSGADMVVNVRCFDSAGAPVDAAFALSFLG
jgi:hypothetical protein